MRSVLGVMAQGENPALGGAWAGNYYIKNGLVIIMNVRYCSLNSCTRPLTGTELQAVEFIDGPDNRVKIGGHWVRAVFRGGQILVHPKAVTI